jgi:hypothetical protein
MKRILDKDFKYTSAAATDIRKTFARVRREQAKAAKEGGGATGTAGGEASPGGGGYPARLRWVNLPASIVVVGSGSGGNCGTGGSFSPTGKPYKTKAAK